MAVLDVAIRLDRTCHRAVQCTTTNRVRFHRIRGRRIDSRLGADRPVPVVGDAVAVLASLEAVDDVVRVAASLEGEVMTVEPATAVRGIPRGLRSLIHSVF